MVPSLSTARQNLQVVLQLNCVQTRIRRVALVLDVLGILVSSPLVGIGADTSGIKPFLIGGILHQSLYLPVAIVTAPGSAEVESGVGITLNFGAVKDIHLSFADERIGATQCNLTN